jgi:hypothetical protein
MTGVAGIFAMCGFIDFRGFFVILYFHPMDDISGLLVPYPVTFLFPLSSYDHVG